MLLPHNEERLAQVQAALAEQARASEPEVRNLGPVLDLSRPLPLEFRGYTYLVPPVPFVFGVRLVGLQERVRRLQDRPDSPESLDELQAILEEAVELFPRLARPTGWRRLFRRVLPNPFRSASEFEIGELIGFFSGCRMRSRVRHPAPEMAPHR
ncbi:MAG TPA: hypothetical protein VHG28_05420 [Longimicrobiaceae bacterium]|nr:hypothetical protein [Longimicrobiaceae bacterium]